MGCIFSKPKKIDEDLRDPGISEKLSCGLTEYWNGKERDFHNNYFNGLKNPMARPSEFHLTTLLDEGAFGSVTLTTHKKSGEIYATKVIAKKKIVKKNIVARVYNEKRIMESIDFPFVVRLVYFYQDYSYLYFVMPFMCGGNLYTRCKRFGPMREADARFYVSEVLLAVEYLHKLDLVHRDIKPENVLIDMYGHAQIADFGFCKRLTGGRTFTLCGTLEYIAPEILLRHGYGKAVDYWAVGVLLYEMIAGRSPFVHRDDEKMFENITEGRYKFPSGFSGDLMNLLRHLLKVDDTERYGNLVGGVQDIKMHRWFQTVDWCALIDRKVPPPVVPEISDIGDTSNFDKPRGRLFLASSIDTYGDLFKDF